MNDPYAVVQCCERLQEAATEAKPSALRHRLQELSDLLKASDVNDPAFSEIRETVSDLAGQAEEIEQLAAEQTLDTAEVVPDSFQRQTTALSQRVCQCYLRAAEIDPDTLPDVDVDATTDAIEEFATEQARLEAETAIWAARAKSVAEERNSALNALNEIAEKMSELDVERRWSPDWEKVVEKERESQRRKEEIEENLRQLREKLE